MDFDGGRENIGDKSGVIGHDTPGSMSAKSLCDGGLDFFETNFQKLSAVP
jgi:hypothetical protein